jgi:hypothetical protein
MHRPTEQRIDDLAMIRDSINNARANLEVAMEAAKRSDLGNRLVPYTGQNFRSPRDNERSARNPQAELLYVLTTLRGLEYTWSRVPQPGLATPE